MCCAACAGLPVPTKHLLGVTMAEIIAADVGKLTAIAKFAPGVPAPARS